MKHLIIDFDLDDHDEEFLEYIRQEQVKAMHKNDWESIEEDNWNFFDI